MSSHLFSPITIGGLTLPNRIVVSPMCQYSAINGVMQAWHRQHLGHLALSGSAAIIIEATGVSKEGRITPGCVGLYNNKQQRQLAKIVQEIGQYSSTKIGIQLVHTGRRASMCPPWDGVRALSRKEGGWQTVAPSSIPHLPGWPLPRELDQTGMIRIQDAFVEAATRALNAGLSIVELHGAHGYLIHEFLSPIANHRKDEFGGSLENRMRFPLSIAQAVRDVWPRNRALGFRISATDWNEDGWKIDDSIIFVKALKRIGVDYVTASSGGIGVFTSMTRDHMPLAEQIRVETGMTTCAVGQIIEARKAEAVLACGQADFVALGRALLDDPRWGWHAAQALGIEHGYPKQYELAMPANWKGYPIAHPMAY
jgi:NADPH2 dehydrogenase